MIKRIIICIFTVALAAACVTSVFTAAPASAAPQGDQVTYSIVSAVVNREYDFKDDFHDSYLYDDDFYTEGVFELDDYNGDVTLTLKNNSTGEEFVFERNSQTEWSVKASIDYLLYETTQLNAQVHIYDLGGDYGIQDVDIPVTITVVSSLYSADYHKYPSYDHSYAGMVEGTDFSVEYDASSPDHKATIKLLKTPWLFFLRVYNVETKEAEYYETDNSVFEFPTEVEVTDFDPSSSTIWFHIPSKLIMEDGYPFNFTLSVNGHLNKKSTDDSPERPASTESTEPSTESATEADSSIAGSTEDGSEKGGSTEDSAATPDSGKASDKNAGGVKQNPDAVKTGESAVVLILALLFLIGGAFVVFYNRKRNQTR